MVLLSPKRRETCAQRLARRLVLSHLRSCEARGGCWFPFHAIHHRHLSGSGLPFSSFILQNSSSSFPCHSKPIQLRTWHIRSVVWIVCASAVPENEDGSHRSNASAGVLRHSTSVTLRHPLAHVAKEEPHTSQRARCMHDPPSWAEPGNSRSFVARVNSCLSPRGKRGPPGSRPQARARGCQSYPGIAAAAFALFPTSCILPTATCQFPVRNS